MTSLNDTPPDGAVAIYNASLDRCTASAGFLDRFYELFLSSSDEVREKFKDTDFKRQKEALRASLYFMMTVQDWSMECDSHIEEIATRHSRAQRDIPAYMYDLWLDCLLRAVREHDPHFNEQVESAWRKVLEPGIAFMKSRY